MNITDALDREDRDRDQACNECRRRKARCDKTLPECGPCKKNRRHCLYERHSKTPLTRKYLTQVEEQLRRAQVQATRAERRAQLAEARVQQLEAAHGINARGPNESDAATDAPAHDEPPIEVPLEGPPSGPADFSWDEQSQESSPPETDPTAGLTSTSQGEDERVVDGMASLTVDEHEAGYLGVASGAAMLRLLLPDAQHAYRKAPNVASSGPQVALDSEHWLDTPLWDTLDLDTVDLDAAIHAYFSLYHNSYPLVEEHTFRAQYAQVIPRPSGRSWHALAFMIAAVGHFTAATGPTDIDRKLFLAAKSNMSIASLEMGNITLVQTLSLMSNYLQKRNKPNSGYNYLGLALHMAMGLGLHKEFHDWDISPLNMEIRRRVWWTMFVFNVGAAITFGRPLAWPNKNVEVHLPRNVSDRALTSLSRTLPVQADYITTYSSVIMQSKFHVLTNDIYTRVISMPFPSATELVRLDDTLIVKWESSVPTWYRRDASIPPRLATGHAIMWWRLSNFRIIMYRPYVMFRVLQARSQDGSNVIPPAVQEAYIRCLREAETSIVAISDFWTSSPSTRMSSWYALYFLFQASLIPCVCLRNEPTSPTSASWRFQISETLRTMQLMSTVNPSAQECYDVIQRLCGPFLQPQVVAQDQQFVATPNDTISGYPTEESPKTQINDVYAMMWPNANHAEVDVLMQDGLWTDLFPGIDETPKQHTNEPNATNEPPFSWE
ncbi:Nn.00g105500.m01.CDS01 [Neocucurbitaria sp. VM-36]